MSDSKDQNEPSMEEILASIRRIISEDDEGNDAGPDGDTGEEPLELTKEVIVEEAPSKAVPNEASSAHTGKPVAAEKPSGAKEREKVEPAESSDNDAQAQEETFEVKSPDKESQPGKGPDYEGLVSPTTAGAATQSLAAVLKAVNVPSGDTKLPGGNRTLEDVVRDALLPELKSWLDQNLAQLVERVVREEIKKMVRRVEDR